MFCPAWRHTGLEEKREETVEPVVGFTVFFWLERTGGGRGNTAVVPGGGWRAAAIKEDKIKKLSNERRRQKGVLRRRRGNGPLPKPAASGFRRMSRCRFRAELCGFCVKDIQWGEKVLE